MKVAGKKRKCGICGKKFNANLHNQRYCPEECRCTARRNKAYKWYQKNKENKKKKVLEEKRCRYCYELFIPTCQQQIFCCDKCRREEYKKRFPARKELQRIEVKDNKKSEKTLADINKIAKSKGLTYGQYMILLQTEKDRKERAKIS